MTLRAETENAQSPSSRSGRSRHAETQISSSDQPLSAEQKVLEDRLRAWRKAEAAKTGKPAFIVFGDKTLRALAVAAPTSLSSMREVSGVGPEKLERYGAEVLAVILGESNDPSPKPAMLKATPLGASSSFADARPAIARPPAIEKKAQPPATPDALTADQQVLEGRLREWRREASERIGMPQFFVLGSATLRDLALAHPRSVPELLDVNGLTQEKVDRFGVEILRVCNS